jgi:hypothetical protein
MKVDQKLHATIIKDTQEDIVSFISKLENEYDQFKGNNLIIDLTQYKSITIKDILLFSNLHKNQKKVKKSFVIVISDFDFNANTKNIMVVPSILEANDMIEMDEIERDLGF